MPVRIVRLFACIIVRCCATYAYIRARIEITYSCTRARIQTVHFVENDLLCYYLIVFKF